MQIVINIPEEQYELVRHGNKSYTTELELMNAVANGTPLSKGHGRLIDVNQIVYEKDCIWESDGCCTTISTPDIDATPTIIEADRGEEE